MSPTIRWDRYRDCQFFRYGQRLSLLWELVNYLRELNELEEDDLFVLKERKYY